MPDRIDPKVSRFIAQHPASEAGEFPIFSDELPVCTSEEESPRGAVDNPTDAFFMLGDAQSVSSPFDSAPVAEGEFDSTTDEIIRFENHKLDFISAVEGYLSSLEQDAGSAVEAFDNLIGAAVNLAEAQDAAESLAKAEKKLAEAKVALDAELASREAHSSAVVAALPLEGSNLVGISLAQAERMQDSDELARLRDDVATAQAERDNMKMLRDASVAAVERLVHEAVAESVPDADPDAVELPPYASASLARVMLSLGETDRAEVYFNGASASAQTVPQSAWYRLEALQLALAKGATPTLEAIEKIKEIREGLPQLLGNSIMAKVAIDDAREHSPFEAGQEIELPFEAGTPDDVEAVDAFSWGILYDLTQAALSSDSISDDTRAELNRSIEKLEEERRQMVADRSGRAGTFEASLHLNNMRMVVASSTRSYGPIERELREEGLDNARKLKDELDADVAAVKKLVFKDGLPSKESPLFDAFAAVEWQASLDGFRSLDLPADGLKALAEKVVPAYPGSESIAQLMDDLHSEARELGVEGMLFTADGSIDKEIDVSDIPAGIAAGERTRSAYYSSSSILRDVGLPIAGSAVCGGAALTLGWTGIGIAAAGGICALAVGYGNREFNTRVTAAERIDQSRKTGFSRIDEKDASRNRTFWYVSQAFNGLFGATPFFGHTAVVGGKALVGGVASLGKGAASMKMSSLSAAAMKTAIGKGAAGLGRLYGKLPFDDKIRFGLGLGLPLDYMFIDKSYKPVLFDGNVDTAVGYVGAAALASVAAHRIFALTWRTTAEGAKSPAKAVMVELADGKTVEMWAFGDQIAKAYWRESIIKAGADLMMADRYLVKQVKKQVEGTDRFESGYSLVDFGAERSSPRDARNFDRQFAFDTPLGLIGLAMFSGDWAMTEWKTLPMYIESAAPFPLMEVIREPIKMPRALLSASRVSQARGRMAIGSTMVAADFIEDGELNKWYLGGLGGSLLMNEAGSIMLQVDAWGSLVATGFRAGTEWIMQWQQDVPIHEPDAKRLMWASAESALMRFPPKMYVMGKTYLRDFPLGKRLIKFHDWMNNPSRVAPIKALGGKMRSIEHINGKPPLLMEGNKQYQAVRVPVDQHKSIKLEYGLNREKLEKPVLMYVVKQKVSPGFIRDKLEGWGVNLKDTKVRLKGKIGNRVYNGEEISVSDISAGKDFHALLKNNGYFVNNKNLWKLELQYRGVVRAGINNSTVTGEDIAMMDAGKKADTLRQLRSEGIHYDAKTKQLFWRKIKDPNAPKILSSHGNYKGDAVSTDANKIVNIPFKYGREGKDSKIMVLSEREMVPIEKAEVGGTLLTIWKGPKRKPHLRWAIPIQSAAMIGTSVATQKYIFQKAMDGDDYQVWERGFNYGFSELITHPIVQWPLGYDTFWAQMWGRSIGTFVHMLGNKMFPVYLNTWPGYETFNQRLDGGPGPLDELKSWAKGKKPLAWVSSLGATQWVKNAGNTAIDYVSPPEKRVPVDALGTWTNTMSSWSPFNVLCASTDATECFEDRGISVFRRTEECEREILSGSKAASSESCQSLPLKTMSSVEDQARKWEEARRAEERCMGDLAFGKSSKSSKSCMELPPKTVAILEQNVEELKSMREKAQQMKASGLDMLERRANALAKNFEEWMERERKGDLSTKERRALVLMGAHMKATLKEVSAKGEEVASRYYSWAQLIKKYDEVLFSKIPELATEGQWKDFTRDVNRGCAKVLDFHYHVK